MNRHPGAVAALHRSSQHGSPRLNISRSSRRHGGALGRQQTGRLPHLAGPTEERDEPFLIAGPRSLAHPHSRSERAFSGLTSVPASERRRSSRVLRVSESDGIGFNDDRRRESSAFLWWRGHAFPRAGSCGPPSQATGGSASSAVSAVGSSPRPERPPWIAYGLLRTRMRFAGLGIERCDDAHLVSSVVYGQSCSAMGIYTLTSTFR